MQPSLQPEFLFRFCETIDRKMEIIHRVCGGYLGPNPSRALRYDRIKESDHIKAEFEQSIRNLLGKRRIADHDRYNRMLTRANC